MEFLKGASALPAFPTAAQDRQIRSARAREITFKRGTWFSFNPEPDWEEVRWIVRLGNLELKYYLRTRLVPGYPTTLWIYQNEPEAFMDLLKVQSDHLIATRPPPKKKKIQTSCIMSPKVFPVAALSH